MQYVEKLGWLGGNPVDSSKLQSTLCSMISKYSWFQNVMWSCSNVPSLQWRWAAMGCKPSSTSYKKKTLSWTLLLQPLQIQTLSPLIVRWKLKIPIPPNSPSTSIQDKTFLDWFDSRNENELVNRKRRDNGGILKIGSNVPKHLDALNVPIVEALTTHNCFR